MSDDPAEEVAKAVAFFLNANAATDFYSFKFTAIVPDNPTKELKREHTSTLQVLVVAGEYSEEKETRGKCFVIPDIQIIISRKIDSSVSESQLKGLTKSIRDSLKFQRQMNWGWRSNETTVRIDHDLLKTQVYLSAFKVSYQGIL